MNNLEIEKGDFIKFFGLVIIICIYIVNFLKDVF